MTMRGKQNLSSAIEIQKENWGNRAFFRDSEATIILKKKTVKYKLLYGVFFFFFFQIEALLSLKNAWLPPIFFLGTKSSC